MSGWRKYNTWTKLPADLPPQVHKCQPETTRTQCFPLLSTLIYWFGYVPSDHGGAVVSTPDPDLNPYARLPKSLILNDREVAGSTPAHGVSFCFHCSSSGLAGPRFDILAISLATFGQGLSSKTTPTSMTAFLTQNFRTAIPNGV